VRTHARRCRAAESCLGGAARLAGAIAAARAEAAAAGRAAIAVDAGDQFMGSLFYTQYRGGAERAVMQAWGCEAMTLGNHEFDNGAENLARFIDGAGFAVLGANVDARAEPALAGRIRPWWETRRGGARLAVSASRHAERRCSLAGRGARIADPGGGGGARPLPKSAPGAGDGPAGRIRIAADANWHRGCAASDAIIGGHLHTLLAASQRMPTSHADAGVRPTGRWHRCRRLWALLGRLDLDLAADGRSPRRAARRLPAAGLRRAAASPRWSRIWRVRETRRPRSAPPAALRMSIAKGPMRAGQPGREVARAHSRGRIAITNGGGRGRAGLGLADAGRRADRVRLRNTSR